MGRRLSILALLLAFLTGQVRADDDDKYDWENLPREYC